MHPIRLSAFVCVTVLAAPLGVAAQEDPRVPAAGQYGLSFSVPEGGGAGIGIRKMLSERANAGVDVTLDWSWSDIDRPTPLPDEESRSTFRIGVMPNVRLYRGELRAVMPFVAFAAGGEYADGPEGSWVATGLLEAGLGAEWFPVEAASLSASAGLRASYGHASSQSSSMETVGLGAFRSSLLLNLYF